MTHAEKLLVPLRQRWMRWGEEMSADRSYHYGQKARLIVQSIIDSGTAGADPKAVARELRSTARSIAQVVVAARRNGTDIVCRRVAGHGVRYWGPGLAPAETGVSIAAQAAMDEIRARLVAAGPAGLLREVAKAGMGEARFGFAATKMRKAGLLFSTPTHVTPYRLYAEAEFVPPMPAPKPKAVKPAKPLNAPKPARVAGLQDVRINATSPHWRNLPPRPTPVVVVPENVKRTYGICPQFDDRYQVDPKTRVIGGFASMGIGRYLEDRA